MNPNPIYVKGFLLAGAYNVFGILIFSKFFTNPLLATIDPDVFSWLGQVAIVLWGFAYWSVAKSHHHVPLLIIVFAVEKLLYSLTWLNWMFEKGATIPTIAADSMLTATFFSIYGAGDIAFCIFFSWVALQVMKAGKESGA